MKSEMNKESVVEDRLVARNMICVDKELYAMIKDRLAPESPTFNNALRRWLGLPTTGLKRGPEKGYKKAAAE